MKIDDIVLSKNNNKNHDALTEQWNPDDPVNSLSAPADHYDRTFIALLSRYNDIKHANSITVHEAEIIIAADDALTGDILTYRYDNTPLTKQAGEKLVSIMKRIQPVDKTFYRGVEYETQDENHIMPIQSWATSAHVAGYFGDIIFQTVEPVRGFELSNVFYFNEHIHDHESNGLTESMGEWLLLEPKMKRFK